MADLGQFIWPDAELGRQPQALLPVDPAYKLTSVVLPPLGINAVTGNALNLTGSPALATTPNGRGYVMVPGALVDALSQSSLGLSACTVVICGWANPAESKGEFGCSSTTLSDRLGAHIPFIDGTVYFDFGGATTGSTRIQVSGLSFAVTDRWVFSVGPRGMEIWQNGILRASNSATPTRTNSGGGAWGLRGNSGGDPASDDGVWPLLAYSPTQWSKDANRAISSNPWKLFSTPTLGLKGAAGSVTTINASLGAWSWAGLTTSFSTQIAATKGAWSWLGNTANLATQINSGVGGWAWGGLTASLTGGINAAVGAWSFAGQPATFATQVAASIGTWSWAGLTSSFGAGTLAASIGSWTWAGTQASLATQVQATKGTWSWAGTAASLSTQIAASKGTWSWAGLPAQVISVPLINASLGSWSWAGRPATIASALSASVGQWNWAGILATVSATPGNPGVRATFGTVFDSASFTTTLGKTTFKTIGGG